MIHWPSINLVDTVNNIFDFSADIKAKAGHSRPIHVNEIPARTKREMKEIQKEVRMIIRARSECLYTVYTRRQKMAIKGFVKAQ